ncbi:MAG TPA: sulfite exporter TauE/SafE family protein [Burkholderiales bacterium]|nr:sulfite exporter TauE/SafE family protein [Burkholderiales bacterium]
MEPSFILLGLAVGVLVGATGVGAGSLVTPALALAGVPPAVAVGTDLAYAAVAKSAGALAHRAQRTLDLRVAGLLALGSVPAAALTVLALAATGAHHESGFVTGALALALVLTALALLGGRARVAALAARYEPRIAPLRSPLTVAAGALLGVLVTVSSVGAGALAAMFLVVLHPGMPAVRIAGTDIAHAVPLTLVAGLGHFWLGTVNLALAATLVVGAVPGIVAGSLLAGRLPDALVRRLLALVLLLAGARLAAASF